MSWSALERTRRRHRRAGSILGVIAMLVLCNGSPTLAQQDELQPLGPEMDRMGQSGGEILRFYPSPSSDACRDDCGAQGAACQAYTWVRPGAYRPGDSSMCYLMRVFGAFSPHSCCVAAARGAPAVPQTDPDPLDD